MRQRDSGDRFCLTLATSNRGPSAGAESGTAGSEVDFTGALWANTVEEPRPSNAHAITAHLLICSEAFISAIPQIKLNEIQMTDAQAPKALENRVVEF
jgi:hypothetical protein